MTRRERLMKTLRGEAVDRPAVNFYEITGYGLDPNNPDPYYIYNDPSWKPLIDLGETETEIIRFGYLISRPARPELHEKHYQYENWEEGRSRFTRMTVKTGGRTLTQLSRRDAEVDTTWVLEHLLKSTDDLRAYLELPDAIFDSEVDVSAMVRQEQEVGEAGIVMVNAGDPICSAAPLFSMEDYTVIALTEPELFHRLLRKLAPAMYRQTETVARDFPGRLWRICGSEYASEPYLPPSLYKEYVTDYTGPIIRTIQQYGGYARLHSHGRLRNILPHIAAMKPDGLDPIEPPGQGDVELREVREMYGREWVLFGNIEVSDIENLVPEKFAEKVDKALREGTAGEGRGFVLMPSASPYGRTITERTWANYTTMVKMTREYKGI